MTKNTTHPPHTFVTNMFGTIGYVSMLFVWLLVFDLIVILASLSGFVNDLSVSLGNATTSVYVVEPTSGADSDTSVTHAPLKFLLIIVLGVLVWIFCYLVAKASSRALRHLLALFGRKASVAMLTMAKYMIMSMGLIGLIVLLQFVEPELAILKLPIAFMGLAAGLVGVGAIWSQRVLVARYRVPVDHVL